MMRKRTWVLLIAVLCAVGAGCGSSDDDDSTEGGGTSGSGGGSGGSGGSAGSSMAGSGGSGDSGSGGGGTPMCVNDEEINPDCPQINPLVGDCAPKGACCHRASNATKEAALGADDDLVLEYRVNYSVTTNHPLTIGTDVLANSTTTRYENERQSTLWRFESPRMGGSEVNGPGKATFGVGRYNCDGTYSYYGETAAPVRDGVSTNQARFKARVVDVDVDTAKTGADRMRPTFANNANRELTYTPFLNDTDFTLDWELIHQGFDIKTIDTTGEGRDCVGARDGTLWTAGGQFIIYTPVAQNDAQTIALISQTYCQLVAFGILAEGMKDMKCASTPRCEPGTADCPWLKLPDSLCPDPENEDEKALFGCHLGAQENINMEEGYPTAQEINCTMEAPTSPADPAAGSPGQCCDPLGGEQSGLPPCNAYRLIQDYVAAAAEIDDTLRNEVQPNCAM